jgi:hypothetical protein
MMKLAVINTSRTKYRKDICFNFLLDMTLNIVGRNEVILLCCACIMIGRAFGSTNSNAPYHFYLVCLEVIPRTASVDC